MVDSVVYIMPYSFVWYIPDETIGEMCFANILEFTWHRYDGPAWSGNRWFILGNRINREDYLSWLEEMEMDISNLSEEDKLLIDIKWGGC